MNGEADQFKKELFTSLQNRYQNNLEKLMKGSESVFMFIYCIVNVIK